MSDKSLEGLKINILGDSIPYGALHLLYQEVMLKWPKAKLP